MATEAQTCAIGILTKSAIRNTTYDIRYTRYDTIMQNKPNFQKSQMNANTFTQMAYENLSDWTLGQNKPNSNPIKPNFRNAQMNVNSLITKDYRKKDDFAVQKNKPNSNPISEKPKMNVNLYVTEDYEDETAFRPKKTNPNKPNLVRLRRIQTLPC